MGDVVELRAPDRLDFRGCQVVRVLSPASFVVKLRDGKEVGVTLEGYGAPRPWVREEVHLAHAATLRLDEVLERVEIQVVPTRTYAKVRFRAEDGKLYDMAECLAKEEWGVLLQPGEPHPSFDPNTYPPCNKPPADADDA